MYSFSPGRCRCRRNAQEAYLPDESNEFSVHFVSVMTSSLAEDETKAVGLRLHVLFLPAYGMLTGCVLLFGLGLFV